MIGGLVAAGLFVAGVGGWLYYQTSKLKPTFCTMHGLRVYAGDYRINRWKVELLTDQWAREHNGGDAKPCHGWSIVFKPMPIVYKGANYYGLMYKMSKRIELGWYADLSKTAFIHELRHITEGDYHSDCSGCLHSVG